MVQARTALAPFFDTHIAKNNEFSPDWGAEYRSLVERVQNENPNFSAGTLRQMWFERSNGVNSVGQGGMSLAEFERAQRPLHSLTRLIAKGCTQENYDEVIRQLKKLKSDGVLNRVYWALCHRAFATFYPGLITNTVNTDCFFHTYNYCNNHFQLGMPEKQAWFPSNLDLKKALHQELGDNLDPIELNMSLWHLYEQIIMKKNAVGLIGSEAAATEAEHDEERMTPQLAKNTILYGPPGTGKTYRTIDLAVRCCEPEAYSLQAGKDEDERRRELKSIYDRLVRDKRVRFVTFHQSIGYEEFIEGLSATTTEEGKVHYSIKTGIFKQICEDAALVKDKNYVLIIDEINRGNVSKIFGELITLIETSKRAGEPEALSVKLPYSFSDFSVPNNLYLIGTMNTADRSLTALDTALRRRFEFEAMLPDLSVLQDTHIHGIDLQKLLKTLNDRIEVLYDREHTLGHSYFLPVVQAKEDPDQAFKLLKRALRNNLLPLLEEYFYNDWQKIRMVLGDNQKNEAHLQFVREVQDQALLTRLFGKTASNVLNEVGASFHLAPESDDPENVWNNPQAWQQIYALRSGNEA